MKRAGIFLLALFFLAALAGCRAEQESGFVIYCVTEAGDNLTSENYIPEASGGEALVAELVEKLGDQPVEKGHRRAIPEGIGITDTVLTGRNLRLDFNGTYTEMDNITEVFCRAAVVKTLLQIPQVNTVEITVNGRELADSQGNPIGVMREDSFIDHVPISMQGGAETSGTETVSDTDLPEKMSDTEKVPDTELSETESGEVSGKDAPGVGVDPALQD